jgi:ribosomal-protein-alanine acetyltransferase
MGGAVERKRMIRRMVAVVDQPGIEELLASSPEAAGWFPDNPQRDVSRGPCVWIARQNGEIIGMVVARTASGEAEILNLAVGRAWRRHGTGRRLVEEALTACKAAGARSAFLEVRESNAGARAFYASLGFLESGRRHRYYRCPEEDALVLSRALSE